MSSLAIAASPGTVDTGLTHPADGSLKSSAAQREAHHYLRGRCSMTAPMTETRVDAVHQLTLPLPRLRALLLRELGDQAAEASACRTTISTLTGQTDVDSQLEREIAEASEKRAEEAIADIEDAMARLDNGTYGACERCGAAIPVERLEAIPHARRCVDCTTQRAGLLG